MNTKNMLLVAGAVLGLVLVGCEDKNNPVNKAANAAGNAASKAVDATKDAAKATVDTAKDAAKATVDAAKDAGKAAVDTAKDAGKAAADAGKAVADKAADAMAAGKTWLSDNIDKAWPAMKTEFDGLTKKVADIKDAGVKAKADALVSDIKTSIPTLESAVDKLKSFKPADGDYTAALTKVKDMWGTVTKKFSDLKAMLK
jgi:hypothetical protein